MELHLPLKLALQLHRKILSGGCLTQQIDIIVSEISLNHPDEAKCESDN